MRHNAKGLNAAYLQRLALGVMLISLPVCAFGDLIKTVLPTSIKLRLFAV